VAAFPGNVDYSAILSTPLSFTIGQGAAKLGLASSGGSAVYGQAVSFLATVGADAGTPGGTVTFADGATPLATVPLDGSGTATFTTSALSLGSHSITATYSGDTDFLGVQSAPCSETVAQTGTEVVVVENSVFKNKKLMSVRLTAEIKPLAPGGGVPGDQALGPRRGRTDRRGDVRAGDDDQEEGESDNARDSGRQRRRGDVDAQGQQAAAEGDHDRLQRRRQ